MVQYKNFKTEDELLGRKEKRFFGKESQSSVTGRHQIELCGCMGLLVYKDDVIRIRLCDSIITISGAGLTLKNYFGGRMVISGRIDKTEYFETEV